MGFKKPTFIRLNVDKDRCCGASQLSSAECETGKYCEEVAEQNVPELSETAKTIGRKIFVPISKREELPATPYEGGERRFLLDTGDVLGFQGVAGKDLSKIFHLLLIPSHENNGVDSQGQVNLRWVYDLQPEHLPLLLQMREAGLTFVRKNLEWFKENNKDSELLKGKPVEYWLQEKNIQFGFHSRPTVGYLHMHMLVGPVTEFGFTDKYRYSWVPLSRVLADLEAQGDITLGGKQGAQEEEEEKEREAKSPFAVLESLRKDRSFRFRTRQQRVLRKSKSLPAESTTNSQNVAIENTTWKKKNPLSMLSLALS